MTNPDPEDSPSISLEEGDEPYSEGDLVESIRYNILHGVHLCAQYAAAAHESGSVELAQFFTELQQKYKGLSQDAWPKGLIGPRRPRRPRY